MEQINKLKQVSEKCEKEEGEEKEKSGGVSFFSFLFLWSSVKMVSALWF